MFVVTLTGTDIVIDIRKKNLTEIYEIVNN